MATVQLSINGRSYEMRCDDGQEAHLHKLAEFIDEKVRELGESVGPTGEPRLLVMVALMIADELFDAYGRIDAMSSDAAGSGDSQAAALEACAARIEALAGRLAGA